MRLFGHSPHQILIVFPAGLLLAAAVFDIFALVTGPGELWTVSQWLILGGLAGGILAAPFGLLDWLNIPAGTRARRIGLLHAVVNVAVLSLFAISWWLRTPPFEPSQTALALSFIGTAFLILSGWLGGELVARLSVGVDSDAYVNASNSLSRHGTIQGGTGMKLSP
jgi:uncharacterized membrane protein